MRTLSCTLVVCLALAATAPAQRAAKDTKFPLDGGNTEVGFVGTKPDGKHSGAFKELTGTATVKGNDVTTLKLKVEIDTASLASDDPKLTKHLLSSDFFNVKKYPKATFTSTKVEKTATGYVIAGELTMLGKTKDVSMPCQVTLTEKGLTLNSSFKIDRTDWGMTYGKGKIDDTVSLTVAINVKR